MAWTPLSAYSGALAALLMACSAKDETPAAAADASTPADAAFDAGPPAADAAPTPDATDSSPCTVPQIVQGPACTACLQQNCCVPTESCLTSADCKGLEDCLNDCIATNGGDAGKISDCAQGCSTSRTAQVRQQYEDYVNCLSGICDPNSAGPCQ